MLSSTSNPRVRAWLRLRDRAGRDERQLTLVDGAREIGRALAAGAQIEEAIIGPRAVSTPEGRATVEALSEARVPTVLVNEAVAERLTFGDRSEGLVAVVAIPGLGLDLLKLPSDPFVVVLEGLEKPGNLGAVLRSADGAGADAVIAADAVTDLYNPNAIRASLGTIFSTSLATAPSSEVRTWLDERGLRVVAALVDGAIPYTEADLSGPIAIVLGSEADGLSATWRETGVSAVRLPMRGVGDSLNVSVAAAILLYEARRQRDAVSRS